VESLRNLQEAVGAPESVSPATVSEDTILRNLSDLNTNDFLSFYVEFLTDDPDGYLKVPESIRTSAEWWLNELRSCITGKDGLFSNDFDPETYVDGFVKFAKGEESRTY